MGKVPLYTVNLAPCLMIFDAKTGELLTRDGITMVNNPTQRERYPY